MNKRVNIIISIILIIDMTIFYFTERVCDSINYKMLTLAVLMQSISLFLILESKAKLLLIKLIEISINFQLTAILICIASFHVLWHAKKGVFLYGGIGYCGL